MVLQFIDLKGSFFRHLECFQFEKHIKKDNVENKQIDSFQ